jgi:dCMP deaminase
MDQLKRDRYLMNLAKEAACQTTCIRRGVGCVLANARGHVLAIGYNGVASGQPHCNAARPWALADGSKVMKYSNACHGYDLPPGRDNCEAVHAEQNALLQCRDAWEIDTAYVTLSPCKPCLKLLLNTSCRRIVYGELHVDTVPQELWIKTGRIWEHFYRSPA